MNKFLEAIHDMIEIITGERPKPPSDKDWETVRSGEDRRSVDRGTADRRSKPKRARGPKGRYKGDDLSTKDFNEAWVGGKAPKKKRKKNGKK